MGLFTRQPMQLKQNLPYTLSVQSKTKLIIGLGNPGDQYIDTRHNSGFRIVDKFAKQNDFSPWQQSSKFLGWVCEKRFNDVRVIMLKSDTFMNESGQAAQTLIGYFKIELSNLAVVYDDFSIPFGQIRTRTGGQSAGHNGVKSLIEHLGQDFNRIKVGIKNNKLPKIDQSKFVLQKFSKTELDNLEIIENEACSILTEFVYGDQLTQDTRKLDIGI